MRTRCPIGPIDSSMRVNRRKENAQKPIYIVCMLLSAIRLSSLALVRMTCLIETRADNSSRDWLARVIFVPCATDFVDCKILIFLVSC